MNEQIKINWYRCKVDKKLMSELMRTSDFRGLCQVIPQLGLFALTGTLAYLAYTNVHVANWMWSVPVLLAALFVHGMMGGFMGMGSPCHELSHKDAFPHQGAQRIFPQGLFVHQLERLHQLPPQSRQASPGHRARGSR